MQNTVLNSDIGNVAHFYGDALMNYHTTINLLCLSCLVLARLVEAHLVLAWLR